MHTYTPNYLVGFLEEKVCQSARHSQLSSRPRVRLDLLLWQEMPH